MNNNVKIASNGGVGNRLRTMIGYAAVYKKLGKPMPVFIWKNSKHAPANNGAYRIKGAEIIDVDEVDDETVMVPGTINVPLMFRTHDLGNPDLKTELEAYGLIDFSDRVKQQADREYHYAAHLRMGDIASEERFEKFRELLLGLNPRIPVYLACDEQQTYDRLRREVNVVNRASFIEIENNMRKTTIEDAAIDMLTCVRAKHFIGTRSSSFTAMIINLRRLNGRKGYKVL